MRRERDHLDFSFLDNLTKDAAEKGLGLGTASPLQHARTHSLARAKPPRSAHAPPRVSRQQQQHPQPPNIHRRTVAPPKNTDQIFRRGKQLSNLKRVPHVKKDDFQSAYERQQREHERSILETEYDPHVMDFQPRSFHEEALNGDFLNERIFDGVAAENGLDSLPNDASNEEQMGETKAVSFEMADVPFDENAEGKCSTLLLLVPLFS